MVFYPQGLCQVNKSKDQAEKLFRDHVFESGKGCAI